MKCKCDLTAAKNGKRNGKQWYLCKCGHQFSPEISSRKHNDFEKLIANILFNKYTCKDRMFPTTTISLSKIAKILGHKYTTVHYWINDCWTVPKFDDSEIKNYLESRENGSDIFNLLWSGNTQPSEWLTQLLTRKQKPKLKVPTQHKGHNYSPLGRVRRNLPPQE